MNLTFAIDDLIALNRRLEDLLLWSLKTHFLSVDINAPFIHYTVVGFFFRSITLLHHVAYQASQDSFGQAISSPSKPIGTYCWILIDWGDRGILYDTNLDLVDR